jgi:hypothetical protein
MASWDWNFFPGLNISPGYQFGNRLSTIACWVSSTWASGTRSRIWGPAGRIPGILARVSGGWGPLDKVPAWSDGAPGRSCRRQLASPDQAGCLNSAEAELGNKFLFFLKQKNIFKNIKTIQGGWPDGARFWGLGLRASLSSKPGLGFRF